VLDQRILALLLGTLLFAPPAAASDVFAFKNGDRVVWLGNTLIEREQLSGYWETALTSRYPDKTIIFRNLGWSGDTVFGEAWASFDPVAVGFRRLRDHVFALKPTVLIIGYGMNESFAGQAGLAHFVQGLDTLLDTLAPTHARVVLLSPIYHEDMGRPLPDPTEHNKNLHLYTEAIRQTAQKRHCFFVDLYDLLSHQPQHLTSNGIHLTPTGYQQSAALLERGLGILPTPWEVKLSADGRVIEARGVRVRHLDSSSLGFHFTDKALPMPPRPGPSNGGERIVQVRDLPAGRYILNVDGKPVASADAKDWAIGVRLTRGPEFEQAEQLRRTIVEKNRLYFNRWRPENETYLFGFRRHEQGQNAVEIPKFDPLVAAKEAAIAKLRVPISHTYEWMPVKEGR